MNVSFDKLNQEQSNLVVLKVLCILEDEKYRVPSQWPFEDISVEDILMQIKKVYSDVNLKDSFVKFCLNHIEKKKQFSLIEGFFNLIYLFENLERYEDCIILKKIKDKILIHLKVS